MLLGQQVELDQQLHALLKYDQEGNVCATANELEQALALSVEKGDLHHFQSILGHLNRSASPDEVTWFVDRCTFHAAYGLLQKNRIGYVPTRADFEACQQSWKNHHEDGQPNYCLQELIDDLARQERLAAIYAAA